MKKFKMTGITVITALLFAVLSVCVVYAAEDAAVVNGQEISVNIPEGNGETAETDESEIHYTTGGSAQGRESGILPSINVLVNSNALDIIPDFASMNVGETKKVNVSGTPGTLTWTSSNNDVATVDENGNITGMSKGFAVVKASGFSGKTDRVKVFVGYYVGADLDVYQGTLNAETLVNSGIDFAIIRRGYGNLLFRNQLDKQFENTYNILKSAGIPVGTYLFNYFENTANAVEEADNLYPYLKDLDLELGVYSDFEEGGEYSSYEYYRRVNGKYPTPEQITEMNSAFLDRIKSLMGEDTPVGYYSSMSQCEKWYSEDFLNKYPLWAAYWRYRTSDPYEDGGSTYSVLLDKVNEYFQGYSYLTYNMSMHQYTCEELAYKVGGNDGWLDMDVIDMDSPLALRFVEIEATSETIGNETTIEWEKPVGANTVDGYVIYRSEDGVDHEIASVDSDVYKYTVNNSTAGEKYVVKAFALCGETVIYSLGGGTMERVFSDVSVKDWYFNSVMYAYSLGIMTGIGGTDRFAPAENLSREQFAVILWRMNDSPAITYKKIFPDVPSGTWFTDAVLWAYGNKIITGYQNGYFGAGDSITREQLCTMFFRYANWLEMDTSERASLNSFTDGSEVSPWAKEAMEWCVAKGIIKGEGNGKLLNPSGKTQRCAAATIIQRFLELDD